MTLLAHLRQLSPFGPVVAGELRSGSRRKRNYFLRVIYLAALLFVLLVWWSATWDRGNVSVEYLAQQQAEMGEIFFVTFSIFSVIAMALICPILTSSAINVERRRKTLGVLLITPITAWQIVSGKLFSRLMTAFWLLGLSLPVVALVRLEGSVELNQIMIGIALAAATAISCGAIGLMYSAVMDQPALVILQSYLFLGCLYGLTALLAGLLASAGHTGFLCIFGINPAVQVAALIDPTMPRDIGIGWMGCVAFQLGLALMLLLATAMRLRRDVQRGDILDGITASQARKARRLAKKEARRQAKLAPSPPLPTGSLFTSADALPDQPDAPSTSASPVDSNRPRPVGIIEYASSTNPPDRLTRPVGDWPVLWHECRAKLLGKKQNALRFSIFLGVALLAGYVISDWRELSSVQMGFSMCFNGVMCLVITVISATMMTQEKESGTWPLLVAAPISGMQIVLSKVAGVGRRSLVITGLIVAHFLVIGPLLGELGIHCAWLYGHGWFAIAPDGAVADVWWPSVMAVYVILTFNSVWVATGIFFSTHLNRTTTAVVCNLMLVLAVFIGVPMFLGIIESLARGNGQVFDRILSTYQPYYYLGLLLDLRPYRYQMQPGLVTVSLFSGITYGQFIVWTIFVGLVHLAIAGWILTWCAMDFNRVTGRAPQTDPLPPRDPADAPATAL